MSNRRLFVAVAACGAALTLAGTAQARPLHFGTFSMDGLQEVPPVPTPGSGSGTLTLDDVTGMVLLSGTYANMIGNVNNAHIHAPAPPGTPAGIAFGLIHTGGTSGTVTGNGIVTPAHVANILAGLSYVNIHSTFRPGGEIRGQIIIPAPGVGALAGLAGLGLLRRRR